MNEQTVKLQIPLNKSLRDSVEKHAKSMGFSSVQDFTRVMYSTVVNNNLQFSLSSTPDVQLSSEAEARYIKQLEEFEKDKAAGKVRAFSDPDAALKFLHSL